VSEQLDALAGYFDAMAQQRLEDSARLASTFTERELLLIKEAAVMGYVQGGMGGGHHGNIPHDRDILQEVLLACKQHPDLYPTITGEPS